MHPCGLCLNREVREIRVKLSSKWQNHRILGFRIPSRFADFDLRLRISKNTPAASSTRLKRAAPPAAPSDYVAQKKLQLHSSGKGSPVPGDIKRQTRACRQGRIVKRRPILCCNPPQIFQDLAQA